MSAPVRAFILWSTAVAVGGLGTGVLFDATPASTGASGRWRR